jgi:hypothetical protein
MKFYQLTYRSDGAPDGFAREFFTSKAERAHALAKLKRDYKTEVAAHKAMGDDFLQSASSSELFSRGSRLDRNRVHRDTATDCSGGAAVYGLKAESISHRMPVLTFAKPASGPVRRHASLPGYKSILTHYESLTKGW